VKLASAEGIFDIWRLKKRNVIGLGGVAYINKLGNEMAVEAEESVKIFSVTKPAGVGGEK